jgi:hypothetical protein
VVLPGGIGVFDEPLALLIDASLGIISRADRPGSTVKAFDPFPDQPDHFVTEDFRPAGRTPRQGVLENADGSLEQFAVPPRSPDSGMVSRPAGRVLPRIAEDPFRTAARSGYAMLCG